MPGAVSNAGGAKYFGLTPRAWVRFWWTGTVITTAGSQGVASVTRSGAGAYTITLSSAASINAIVDVDACSSQNPMPAATRRTMASATVANINMAVGGTPTDVDTACYVAIHD